MSWDSHSVKCLVDPSRPPNFSAYLNCDEARRSFYVIGKKGKTFCSHTSILMALMTILIRPVCSGHVQRQIYGHSMQESFSTTRNVRKNEWKLTWMLQWKKLKIENICTTQDVWQPRLCAFVLFCFVCFCQSFQSWIYNGTS